MDVLVITQLQFQQSFVCDVGVDIDELCGKPQFCGLGVVVDSHFDQVWRFISLTLAFGPCSRW